MRQLLWRLRRSVGDRGGASDAELLDAYCARGDAEALAALVDRHGAMVLGVCRRTLGDRHLAEDAFQATFLVLLRKAGAIRPGSQLSGWLHGVARTALAAKVSAARRQRLERGLAARASERSESPLPTPEHEELVRIIDRELQRLPAYYRSAIVMCDLQGRARKEAAAELGWPEGTLSCRLARARKLLAGRLVRAGVAPAAAAVAVVEAGTSQGAVPVGLGEAVRGWLWESLTPSPPSPLPRVQGRGAKECPSDQGSGAEGGLRDPGSGAEFVRELADQVERDMSMKVTKWIAAAVLIPILGTALIYAATGRQYKPANPPAAEKPQLAPLAAEKPQPAPPAKPDPGWHLILDKNDGTRRMAMRLSDGEMTEILVSRASGFGGGGDALKELATVSHSVSPDGRKVLYEMHDPRAARINGVIVVTDIDGKNHKQLTDTKQDFNPTWSPDGKKIVFLSNRAKGEWHLFSLDADAEKDNAEQITREPVTDNCKPCYAADGRLIYTVARGQTDNKVPLMDLVAFDGKKLTEIVKNSYVIESLVSPNGTKLAYLVPNELVIHDLKTGKEQKHPMKEVNPDWRVTYVKTLWRRDSEAIAFALGFLAELQQGIVSPGADHVGVLWLDGTKPAMRTFKVGEGCGLFAWYTDEDFGPRK